MKITLKILTLAFLGTALMKTSSLSAACEDEQARADGCVHGCKAHSYWYLLRHTKSVAKCLDRCAEASAALKVCEAENAGDPSPSDDNSNDGSDTSDN